MPNRESPWSLRGVSQQAKGAAADAAKKAGMPLGAWLSEVILRAATLQQPHLSGLDVADAGTTEVTTTVGHLQVRVVVSAV